MAFKQLTEQECLAMQETLMDFIPNIADRIVYAFRYNGTRPAVDGVRVKLYRPESDLTFVISPYEADLSIRFEIKVFRGTDILAGEITKDVFNDLNGVRGFVVYMDNLMQKYNAGAENK